MLQDSEPCEKYVKTIINWFLISPCNQCFTYYSPGVLVIYEPRRRLLIHECAWEPLLCTISPSLLISCQLYCSTVKQVTARISRKMKKNKCECGCLRYSQQSLVDPRLVCHRPLLTNATLITDNVMCTCQLSRAIYLD